MVNTRARSESISITTHWSNVAKQDRPRRPSYQQQRRQQRERERKEQREKEQREQEEEEEEEEARVLEESVHKELEQEQGPFVIYYYSLKGFKPIITEFGTIPSFKNDAPAPRAYTRCKDRVRVDYACITAFRAYFRELPFDDVLIGFGFDQDEDEHDQLRLTWKVPLSSRNMPLLSIHHFDLFMRWYLSQPILLEGELHRFSFEILSEIRRPTYVFVWIQFYLLFVGWLNE